MIKYDLLLKGARVIDPSQGIDKVLDIGVVGSVLMALGENIPAERSARTIDLRGHIATPGLIDGHTHVFPGGHRIGLDADILGVGSGVTTVVDTGSSGPVSFKPFRHFVVQRAATNVLCFVNLSLVNMGLGPVGGHELSDLRFIDIDAVVQVVNENRDRIRGIKLRASALSVGKLGLEPVRLGKKAARLARVPLLVHIGETDPEPGLPPHPPTREIVSLLEEGDILCHLLSAKEGGILDERGRIYPEVLEAARRGVIFDVAHGLNNVSYEVARKVLDQGLVPQGLSTDGHTLNRTRIVFDLPTVMSKFMAMGFSLEQVIAMTTINPAKYLGLEHQLGSLQVGRVADISALELIQEEWTPRDSEGKTLAGKTALDPILVVRAGQVILPGPYPRPYGRNRMYMS